jgi:RNA 2',3'-cyclic 3'-phosphodiesterase
MRTFIAIDTPQPIKDRISEIQSELRKSGADVKWEGQNKFHITIKFLGEVQESMIDNVISSLRNVSTNFSPFSLQYADLGSFPNFKNPKVIWIGCKDISLSLLKIRQSLDKDLQKLGFDTEEREFHPHITLGRVRSDNQIKDLIPIIENLKFESEVTECREILVLKSILKSSGSEYSLLQSVILKKEIHEIK